MANDYTEKQHKCLHCKNGTNFRIVEVQRPWGPDDGKGTWAIAIFCTLCDEITFIKKDALGTIFEFVVSPSETKKKTTKRIA